MDYMRIIQKEGYRLEDLDDEARAAITAMNWLRNDLAENFEYEMDEEEKSIIGRLKREIAADVFEQVLTFLDIDIAEHQITFAEADA